MKKFLLTILFSICLTPMASANSSIAFLRYTGGYWQVWTMNQDGTSQKQVTTSKIDKRQISWFKDGKRLLVSDNYDGVYTVDLGTGKEQKVKIRLPKVKVYARDFVLSPDGKEVAYVFDRNAIGDGEIWIASLDGKSSKMIFKSHDFLTHPVWTYDGQSIVYRVVPYNNNGEELGHNIWIMTKDGKNNRLIMTDYPSHSDQVCSKNNQITFSSIRIDKDYNIWVVDMDGKGLKRITNNIGEAADPTWSPDGHSIAFGLNKTGKEQIWLMKRDGTALKQLTHGPQGARRPVWSYEY